MQSLKDSSPPIPDTLELFFNTLLCGVTPTFSGGEDHRELISTKVESLASDMIYNVSRGAVRPWKNIVLGLSISSLTGSKLVSQILSREGHAINYTELKGLETEFAYTIASEERESPDGIRLQPNLATACAWDNNDANIETLDGRSTLHATVGHTYQNIVAPERHSNYAPANATQERVGRNRRKFIGEERR